LALIDEGEKLLGHRLTEVGGSGSCRLKGHSTGSPAPDRHDGSGHMFLYVGLVEATAVTWAGTIAALRRARTVIRSTLDRSERSSSGATRPRLPLRRQDRRSGVSEFAPAPNRSAGLSPTGHRTRGVAFCGWTARASRRHRIARGPRRRPRPPFRAGRIPR